ncbi:MAG: oligoendopeptidase F, partial [Chthoniobacterales bacterium]|nr:oligoendopeptidase F [Chthoniobacterales bacterium]
VAEEFKWDLKKLYRDDEQWREELRRYCNLYPRIGEFRGRLGEGAKVLAEALELEREVNELGERLSQYAALRVAEDSGDSQALALEAELQAVQTKVGEAFAFLQPEIQALGDEDFEGYLGSPELEEWRIPLRKIRRMKPHTLSAAEERILALGASAVGGHGEAFSQLLNVDLKFGSVRDEDGKERELSQSSFSSFLVRRERRVREEAFRKFYEQIEGHRYTLAALLASSVRADVFYARARNFGSCLEAALFYDDIPVEVYENLVRTVRSRLGALFQYYRLRRRVLGLEELHHFDLYVPLVGEVKTDVSWEEAVEMVVGAVEPLGEDYVRELQRGLTTERWCDRYENKGKRGGAFSYGTYRSLPYILMNYKRDVFADVFTLAHEAGHSMHTLLASRAQLFQNYHYPIFLAEVASTFHELLLTEYLLGRTEDRKMRAFLVNRQLDDIRGTMFRQTMFAEFELEVHGMEERGEAVTLDSLRRVYRGLLEAYFGGEVVIDRELEVECLRIPHFYSAFYVYKYATGLSAAVALAKRVLEEGEREKYLSFLRSGGSKFPLETLLEAGVDLRTPEPIEATLDLFEKRVVELEELMGVRKEIGG